MTQLPRDPQKIKGRIKRYERALANKKKRWGDIDDGAGVNYH